MEKLLAESMSYEQTEGVWVEVEQLQNEHTDLGEKSL